MAKFRIDSIADLSRQLAFSPHEARAAQVSAAEELLHLIDPATAYPLDFVVFRITGYHPRQVAEDLLTGLALQHDLGLLIERVSDTLDVRTESLAEPVLGIADVTARFNVTSKTVQRWRRKGLPARKFLFSDGKRRVGFLLASVERFFWAHRDQVARGANFSQLTETQRQEILARARRLAVRCGCCVGEICRRIARKMGRSPLTVQHTIRKHDEEHPGRAIFPSAAPAIAEEDRASILKACRRGMDLKALARRLGRTRAAVARVVVEERVARLNRKKVRFIDDPLYHGDGAGPAVGAIAAQEELAAEPKRDENRVPRDLPPYLQDLYRTPLLTPARERALFLKFNFEKFQFVAARRRLDPQFANKRDLGLLETLLRRATETKNDIVRANLRLVVSIARKHLRPGRAWNSAPRAGGGSGGSSDGAAALAGDPTLMELVSEGNLTLMRAVESFDPHKGYRFSTYATLALMKGFARSVPLMRAGVLSGRKGAAGMHRLRADVRLLADVADPRGPSAGERLAAREEVGALLARLDDRERSVLVAHFGLWAGELPGAPAAEPRAGAGDGPPHSRLGPAGQTHEQVGRRLGLSKQRVRQIEQSALAKLRALVNPTLS